MASNDVEKIVSLAILTYYDNKIKTWVRNKISQQGIIDITEEQVQNIVNNIVGKMVEDGDIANQDKIKEMIETAIDESGVGVSETKVQEMIDDALKDLDLDSNSSFGQWGTM